MATLDRPELSRLWERVAERLQRNGLAPDGVVVLEGLDRDERHALSGLLARPVTTSRAKIDLAVLDARIRVSGVSGGLVEAVERWRGPLVDRVAQREAIREERAAVWAAVRQAVRREGLVDRPWVEPWLEGLRRSGVLSRLAGPRAQSVLHSAVRCLAVLPGPDGTADVGRGELATRVTGDAHGLDDGSVLAAVVLRAAALLAGVPQPETPRERRAVWRAVGVLPDEVSATVLTLGLLPLGEDPAAVALRRRTEHGWEAHVTLRDLRRLEWRLAAGTEVSVCENPRVLESAMDAGSRAPVVCTQGNPTVVVTALLDVLVAGGGKLRYHGDFDWAGVAIANRMVVKHGCHPWRMSPADYEEALARAGRLASDLPLLEGASVAAVWDEDLAVAMARRRRAVHEELVLDLLLHDLGR